MRVSQMALPIEALPPALFILAFVRKKSAMSKMKAIIATAAAKPDIQVLQHVMDISRTCARRPKTADPAAKTSATMWRTRQYVIHLTTTLGISILVVFPSKVLMSEGETGQGGEGNKRSLLTVARSGAERLTVLTKLVAHRGF